NVPVDNVLANIDIPNTISYNGDLKIDNTSFGGDLNSGINLGTISANTSKSMAFSGTVQSQNDQPIQVTGRIAAGNSHDSDFLTISALASNTTGSSTGSSSLVDFVKKWYLWIIII